MHSDFFFKFQPRSRGGAINPYLGEYRASFSSMFLPATFRHQPRTDSGRNHHNKLKIRSMQRFVRVEKDIIVFVFVV